MLVMGCTQKDTNRSEKPTDEPSSVSSSENKLKELDSIMPTVISYDSFVDVGFVETKNAEAVFLLKNIGENPLHIAAISPSCGCTSSTEAPDKPIDVGNSFEIKVSIDMNRVKGGNFEKTLTVLSNSQERVLLLRIIGKKV